MADFSGGWVRVYDGGEKGNLGVCGLVWGIDRLAAAWVRVRAAFGDG